MIIRLMSYPVKHFIMLMFIVWLLPTVCLANDWNITSEGYGPVHVGMSIRQAEKLLNTQLHTSENIKLNPSCDFVYPQNSLYGVAFMVQGGRITHVDADSRSVSTDAGIRIGDPVNKLTSVYGKKIEKKAATDGYIYFVWKPNKKGTRGIKYMTDEGPGEGRVTGISGGDSTIKLMEGCS